jgi:hypothetical protein
MKEDLSSLSFVDNQIKLYSPEDWMSSNTKPLTRKRISANKRSSSPLFHLYQYGPTLMALTKNDQASASFV